MPSQSLIRWKNERLPGLAAIERQFVASTSPVPYDPRLVQENLRGYIVLLSAHFQGFCRELYAESSLVIVARVRRSLQVVVQLQCSTSLALDRGNPNYQNLKRDFERLGFSLNLAAADPANSARLRHLDHLNHWRNIAAHHGTVPPGGLPVHRDLQEWTGSCDGLAMSLDEIMYNRLRRVLRRNPWAP